MRTSSPQSQRRLRRSITVSIQSIRERCIKTSHLSLAGHKCLSLWNYGLMKYTSLKGEPVKPCLIQIHSSRRHVFIASLNWLSFLFLCGSYSHDSLQEALAYLKQDVWKNSQGWLSLGLQKNESLSPSCRNSCGIIPLYAHRWYQL